MTTRVITHCTMIDARKRCTECGEFLPRSRFYRFHAMEDGLSPWCKTCVQLPSRRRHETVSPGDDRIATLCREIQQRWTPGQRRRAIDRARRVTGGIA